MHTDHLNKAAVVDPKAQYAGTPLSQWVQNLMAQHLKDKPTKMWDKRVTPEMVPAYTDAIHQRQSQAAGQLTDLLMRGLLVGGGIGAAHGIPKLLRTKKELKPESSEPEALKIAECKSAGETMDAIMRFLGQAGAEAGKATAAETEHQMYGGIPKTPAGAPGPFGLPPGSLWPAYVAAPALAAYGGGKLVNWLTNKTRNKMIERRKRELQREFQESLSGAKTASVHLIDRMADAWMSKKAFGFGEKLTGASLLLALGLAGIGGTGGYALGKRNNPSVARRKTLEDALKRKSKEKPLTLQFEPTEGDEVAYETPEPISELSRDVYNLPIQLNQRRQMFESHDPALELSKLGALRKYADLTDWLKGTIKDVATENAGPVLRSVRKNYAEPLLATNARLNAMMDKAEPAVTAAGNAADAWSKFKGGIGKGWEGMKGMGKQLLSNIPGLMEALGQGEQKDAPDEPSATSAAESAPKTVENVAAPAVAPAPEVPVQPAPVVAPVQPAPVAPVQPPTSMGEPMKTKELPMPAPVVPGAK